MSHIQHRAVLSTVSPLSSHPGLYPPDQHSEVQTVQNCHHPEVHTVQNCHHPGLYPPDQHPGLYPPDQHPEVHNGRNTLRCTTVRNTLRHTRVIHTLRDTRVMHTLRCTTVVEGHPEVHNGDRGTPEVPTWVMHTLRYQRGLCTPWGAQRWVWTPWGAQRWVWTPWCMVGYAHPEVWWVMHTLRYGSRRCTQGGMGAGFIPSKEARKEGMSAYMPLPWVCREDTHPWYTLPTHH